MSALAIMALSIGYGLAGTATACRVATLLAWSWMRRHNESYDWSHPYRSPTGEHWFGGAILGLLSGTIWPLVIAAAMCRSALFAPPREIREQRQREYIAKLERELGIAGEGEHS